MDSTLLGRRIDAPLDEHGEQQARRLAEHLSSRLRRPLIEASPRLRTRQTAAAIGARCDCEVRTCASFDEIDFGRWSGRTFADLQHDPDWSMWNADRANARTPAGETIADVQQRAFARLATLAREHLDRTIVIVTHSEIIRSLVLFCVGASPNGYDKLAIDPASVSMLSMDADRLRIDCVNERPAS